MNLVFHNSVRLTIICSAFGVWAACQSTTPANDAAPREIHTPAYDLLLPAEEKALPLLRRSGFAKAQ
jgi:hypothetical protein